MGDLTANNFIFPTNDKPNFWEVDLILDLCLSHFNFTRLKRIRLVSRGFYQASSRIQRKLAKTLTLNAQRTPAAIMKNNLLSFISTFCGKSSSIPFSRFLIDLSKNVGELSLYWRILFNVLNQSPCFALKVCFLTVVDNKRHEVEEAAKLRRKSLSLNNLRHLTFKIELQNNFVPSHVNVEELLLNNDSINHLEVEMYSDKHCVQRERAGMDFINSLEQWKPPSCGAYLTELALDFFPLSANYLQRLSFWKQRILKLRLGQFSEMDNSICDGLHNLLANVALHLVELEIYLKPAQSPLRTTPLGDLKFPTMPLLRIIKISSRYQNLITSPFLSNDDSLQAALPKLSKLSFHNISWAKTDVRHGLSKAEFTSVQHADMPTVNQRFINMGSNCFIFLSKFKNLTSMSVNFHGIFLQQVFVLCPLLTTLKINRVTDNYSFDDFLIGVPQVNQLYRALRLNPQDDFHQYYSESLPSILQLKGLTRLDISVRYNCHLSDVSIYNAFLRLQHLRDLRIVVNQHNYEPQSLKLTHGFQKLFSDQGCKDLRSKLNLTLDYEAYLDKTT